MTRKQKSTFIAHVHTNGTDGAEHRAAARDQRSETAAFTCTGNIQKTVVLYRSENVRKQTEDREQCAPSHQDKTCDGFMLDI